MLLLFASSPSDTCHIAVEAAIRLILALVTSRIDYSNSLLAGVPLTSVPNTFNVSNTPLHLRLLNSDPKERVTPYLLQLHWLLPD